MQLTKPQSLSEYKLGSSDRWTGTHARESPHTHAHTFTNTHTDTQKQAHTQTRARTRARTHARRHARALAHARTSLVESPQHRQRRLVVALPACAETNETAQNNKQPAESGPAESTHEYAWYPNGTPGAIGQADVCQNAP